MPRLIDANELERRLNFSEEVFNEVDEDGLYAVICVIDEIPTVDAERHGHWIHDYDVGCTTCSECGDHYLWEDFNGPGDWNYCPNCGAKMQEVEDAKEE